MRRQLRFHAPHVGYQKHASYRNSMLPGSVTVVCDGAYFSPHSPSGKVRMIDPRYSQITVRAVRTHVLAATVGPHRTHLCGPWWAP